jgi:hypothetical protein
LFDNCVTVSNIRAKATMVIAMDNAIGTVVNVNVVKDSVILAGGKTQSVLSQVVEGNIGNEDHRDVDGTMDNENNPEQVPTSQVVKVNIGSEYHRDVDVTMDNANFLEQPPTSQFVGVIDVKEVYEDVDVTMNEEDGNVVNVVNEDNPEQVVPSHVVEVNTVDKDPGNVDIAVDNENMKVVSLNEDKSEQVPTSQVAGVVNMDEVHADVKVSEANPEEVLSRQAVEMVIFFNSLMSRDVIDPDSNACADDENHEDHVDEIAIVIDSDSDSNGDVSDSDSGSDVIVVGSESDSDVDAEHDGDRGDMDVVDSDSNSNVIVVGFGSNSDSSRDSEYDEDVIEPWRDVVDNINPKGGY